MQAPTGGQNRPVTALMAFLQEKHARGKKQQSGPLTLQSRKDRDSRTRPAVSSLWWIMRTGLQVKQPRTTAGFHAPFPSLPAVCLQPWQFTARHRPLTLATMSLMTTTGLAGLCWRAAQQMLGTMLADNRTSCAGNRHSHGC